MTSDDGVPRLGINVRSAVDYPGRKSYEVEALSFDAAVECQLFHPQLTLRSDHATSCELPSLNAE